MAAELSDGLERVRPPGRRLDRDRVAGPHLAARHDDAHDARLPDESAASQWDATIEPWKPARSVSAVMSRNRLPSIKVPEPAPEPAANVINGETGVWVSRL